MGGLNKVCRMYGGMTVSANGKKVHYVWDYAQEKARPEKEMTQDEKKLSEKAKWQKFSINP